MGYLDDAWSGLRKKLEITPTEQAQAIRRHTQIREHVEGSLALRTHFLTGSYARHTKTKKLKDVDIFCVVSADGEDAGLGHGWYDCRTVNKNRYYCFHIREILAGVRPATEMSGILLFAFKLSSQSAGERTILARVLVALLQAIWHGGWRGKLFEGKRTDAHPGVERDRHAAEVA